MDFDKFYGKLWKQGNSLIVTIPDNIVKGIDYKENDEVVVMIKKK